MNTNPGNGGAGISSDITGSSVARGGGGAGGGYSSGFRNGTASAGGGAGAAGTANTGGGGRVGSGSSGFAGGSGVVILRFPNSVNLTVGAGLTYSDTTVGDNKVYTFTAGSDTVTFI